MSFLRDLHHSSSSQYKDGADTMIEKIVSGGQTGVDRAALDVAIKLNISHGGWCPRGRKAEDGVLTEQYCLCETDSDEYSERTKLNIRDSDGTLILVPSTPIKVTDGTILTITEVKEKNKPYLIIDLAKDTDAISKIIEWAEMNKIRVLNFAGPRESQSPGIYKLASELLSTLFEAIPKKEIELGDRQSFKI